MIRKMTLLMVMTVIAGAQSPHWGIHDMERPKPKVITPGTFSSQEKPGMPPSDAVVLFDGKDLSEWCTMDGGKPQWKVENGYLETVGGAGAIRTWRAFGDCQLHVEWAAPTPAVGSGQGRGNSGVFLMGKYEVQVLDCYQNTTYADGQTSAIYGQYPPLVNACRKPGEWQTYDIIFTRPRFDENGELLSPAYITVLHNGVLTQNHSEVLGPTNWQNRIPYAPHPDRLYLALQDHSNPVRYRNIWIRQLPEGGRLNMPEHNIAIPENMLENYVGVYKAGEDHQIPVKVKNGQLYFQPNKVTWYPLTAQSLSEFTAGKLAAKIVFTLDKNGKAIGLTEYMGGGEIKAERME